jgi:hypothetical protein
MLNPSGGCGIDSAHDRALDSQPKIELKMTSEWIGAGSGSTMKERVSVTVPLEHGMYSVTTPPGCRVDMKPVGGDLAVTEAHFDEFESASGLSLAGDRKLVGHKEVTRSTTIESMKSTAKTTFEFWWVGLETPTK